MNINKSISALRISRNTSDTWGAMASGLCMIHCMCTPLLFLAQATAASCASIGPVWWRSLDYLFIVVSLLAIRQSCKHTTLSWMPAAMYSSWGLLVIFTLNHSFGIVHLPGAIHYLPATLLVGLHIYNRRYCACVEEDVCCAS